MTTSGTGLVTNLLIAVVRSHHPPAAPGRHLLPDLAGDEFVIVCEGLDEESQIHAVAERVVDAMSMPFDLSGISVDLSASVGIAFAHDGDSPEGLVHRADVAMYQVKRKGGANHQVIDVDEQQRSEYIDSLKRDLAHAVSARSTSARISTRGQSHRRARSGRLKRLCDGTIPSEV